LIEYGLYSELIFYQNMACCRNKFSFRNKAYFRIRLFLKWIAFRIGLAFEEGLRVGLFFGKPPFLSIGLCPGGAGFWPVCGFPPVVPCEDDPPEGGRLPDVLSIRCRFLDNR
jgi:hypothetical protein